MAILSVIVRTLDYPFEVAKASKPVGTVIELFAGVGGFRLGLEKAGWETVWSNQWEPSTKIQHASSVYVKNFGPEGHSNEDIEIAIDKHESGKELIPDADLIVGGFPCQDYSVAKTLNTSLGLAGKKGVLWWQIHRLVALKKPKFVFLENVDRLLKSPSSNRGRDFAVMLRTLADLGYDIEWRVVNAAEQGFPQRRIRVFIVAYRKDLNLESDVLARTFGIKEKINTFEFELDTDPEKISDEFNAGAKQSPFLNYGSFDGKTVITSKIISPQAKKSLTLGDVLMESNNVPEEYFVADSKLGEWQYLKGSKKIERVSKSGFKYHYAEGSMAFPDLPENPSRTILTGEGGSTPSRFKHIILQDGRYRRLTPIELERLNGFPDNWTAFGEDEISVGDGRRAFFMGNALVVGLIEMVGLTLWKIID